jgi:PPOX class probable F420-dependent enzyme
MAVIESIPQQYKDLLTDQKKTIAHLATIMADGTPQVTPVWFNMEGNYIFVNSALGRVKDRNMRANPNIALAISDPQNPYRYIQIRGLVEEITTKGARDHINALSKKYTGNDVYAGPQDEQRVIYKIMPKQTSGMG